MMSMTIKFGSFDPVEVAIHPTMKPISPKKTSSAAGGMGLKNLQNEDLDQEEGWTLVTHRRSRKKNLPTLERPLQRMKCVKVAKGELKVNAQYRKKPPASRKREEPLMQKFRVPITLADFMPQQFYKQVPTLLSCHHANEQEEDVKEETVEEPTESVEAYTTKIAFSDEDLLLGNKLHNRPLFVVGFAQGKRLNRILVDDGSAVNILHLQVFKQLGMPVDELLESWLMIQRFNQGG